MIKCLYMDVEDQILVVFEGVVRFANLTSGFDTGVINCCISLIALFIFCFQ